MIKSTTLAALLALSPLALSPVAVHAHDSDERAAMLLAVDGFFDALGSEDRTLLADHMAAEGVIFIHNRMDPDNPVVQTRTIADHLAGWAQTTRTFSEAMYYERVSYDGDMGHVWGPYAFFVDGEIGHCGINSMSMVKGADGAWKVGNTSFTMVPPAECEALGAPLSMDDVAQ